MGKFDGILICTDLDDTFRRGEESVILNSRAVRYFLRNGGRFTFATGRSEVYMLDQPFFDLINAPAIVYNGACVYDYATELALHTVPVSITVGDFLEGVDPDSYAAAEVHICNRGGDLLTGVPGKELGEVSRSFLNAKPLKFVLVFESEREALEFMDYARSLPLLQKDYVFRSWDVGVEITAGTATKGHALRFLKAHLGNIHTAIGVGNYENDVPLLEFADLGVAVDNALDCVKNAADWIVLPAEEGGIADLIQRLDRNLEV